MLFDSLPADGIDLSFVSASWRRSVVVDVCEPQIEQFCQELEIPATPETFVKHLQ